MKSHPPAFAGAVSALLASLVSDFQGVVAELPVLSDTSANLLLYLGAGILGGLIGKFSEKYTIPFEGSDDSQ